MLVPLVSSLPRVRVRVRVLLELTRAAGWMLEKTLICCDLLGGGSDGRDAMSGRASARERFGKGLEKPALSPI